MNDRSQKAPAPKKKTGREEESVPGAYPVIDNDLARDNLENDIPDADLNELRVRR